MAEGRLPRCTFCGKPENEVETLLSSGPHYICDGCVNNCKGALDEKAKAAAANDTGTLKKPHEFKALLDEYVIAQDGAKIDVSMAVYNHYKRRQVLLKNKGRIVIDVNGHAEPVEISKSNILLMGPSGTGKTEIARTVARILNVPFYVCDATKLTQAGYVGDDVESMLQGLIAAANQDLERAEWGICFIDEADKLARKSGRGATGFRDVTGEGVQQSLLKLVEGSRIMVPRGNAKMGIGGDMDPFDTTNVLFIAAGSFAGIEEVVKARINKHARLGFGAPEAKKFDDLDKSAIYSQVTEDDVLEFGMIPELMGRLPVLTTTLDLTEDQIVEVLTKPKNAILKQFRALFQIDGIDLQFEETALRAIAKEAKSRPTGARALRSIMERVLKEYGYECPKDPSIMGLRVTKDCVEGKGKAIMTRRPMQATA
jgi:ATP-dependent Clp protease ATP-binding subunit ClpX